MTEERYLGQLEDEFTLDDIGSTLLEELAKGLYESDEVIREYIQNAVDAHRQWLNLEGTPAEGPITIEVRGDKISILDFGIGMDDKYIRKVKSIAVSQKRSSEIKLTGHKGVGVWAGLSYFEKLTIYSTRRGESRGYRLTILFKNIVEAIREDVSIAQVLNPNYRIDIFEADTEAHYTDVTLENPTKVREWFLDADNIVDAVRRICPTEIDPTFALNEEVTKWYRDNSFEVFNIVVDGQPVYKSYPSTIERFASGNITIDDKVVAKYWHAINKKNRMLELKDGQMVGFRIIQDGFALGGENNYSGDKSGYTPLKLATYPKWYIGEIHITEPALRPDLSRTEFEESEIARKFINKLREWYQSLADDTRIVSEERSKRTEYEKYEEFVRRLEGQAAPLNLGREDKEELINIQAKLTEAENTVEANKKKRAVDYSLLGYVMAG
jgi:hypothetical protein